ncbi:hypothetical protein BDZ45DRAFT_347467 [Acephala macrosclerotiorum]|nr:hypothetical protein BDZ45DRAFT_347467 [Acephala macrosclerotiorum]
MLQFMHRATLEILPRELRVSMAGVPSACLQFIAWSNVWYNLDECHVYCARNVSSDESKMCLQGFLSSTTEILQILFNDIVLMVNQAPAESGQATRILLALELLHRFLQRPMLNSAGASDTIDRILNDLKEAGHKQVATIRKTLKNLRLDYGAYFCPESEDVLLKCLEVVPLLKFKLNLSIEKHKLYILGLEDFPSIHPRSFKDILETNLSPIEDYLPQITLHDIPKSMSCGSSKVDLPKLSYNSLCALQKQLSNFTNSPRPRVARYVAPQFGRSIPTGRRASIVVLSEPRDPFPSDPNDPACLYSYIGQGFGISETSSDTLVGSLSDEAFEDRVRISSMIGFS